jgi:lipopolysaccharide heptosyltransferase II
MKIWVRLPNWVGDTLLALPALAGLRDAYRGGVGIAGRAAPLQLAGAALPDLTTLRLPDGHRPADLWRTAASARRHGAAAGLLLTPSFSAALWLLLTGARRRIGWRGEGRAALLTQPVARAGRGRWHLREEFVELARAAGAASFPAVPELPCDPAAAGEAGAFLDALPGGGPLVAFCPGARYGPAKQWPLPRFCELARRLAGQGIRGVIVGTAEEAPAAEAIVAAAGAPGWRSAAGRGRLLWSAEILRAADAAVSNDSGAMHLAAAVGTPVVALFGSTDPLWTGPLGPGHQIVRAPLPCAPCFRPDCGRGDPAPCMARIEAAEVAERVALVLAEGGREGLGAPGRRPALFLDRDGTLLEPVPYLHDPQQVRLVAGAAVALRAASEAGYCIVVVTNQAGIARGLFRREAVEAVHTALAEALAREGVAVERFYFCPHHPEFDGACQCRKPAPGMLRLAARELALDLGASVMIGDTRADLAAGEAAGCRAILVETGYGAAERRAAEAAGRPPVRVARDLPAAVAALLRPDGGGGASAGGGKR